MNESAAAHSRDADRKLHTSLLGVRKRVVIEQCFDASVGPGARAQGRSPEKQ